MTASPSSSAVGLQPGDRVYLIPRTATAPQVAYRRPRVTFVRYVEGQHAVCVVRHEHCEITVSTDNVVRRLPDQPRPRPARPRPVPELAAGCEQTAMW